MRLLLIIILASTVLLDHPVTDLTASFPSGQDSVLLAVSSGPFLLDSARPSCSVALKMVTPIQRENDGAYLVYFDRMRMSEAPEGVYEVYLTLLRPSPDSLYAGKDSFIDVLDTYALSGQVGARQLHLDVTRQMRRLLISGAVTSCFVTISFQGNGRPDNHVSGQGGRLGFETVRLIRR